MHRHWDNIGISFGIILSFVDAYGLGILTGILISWRIYISYLDAKLKRKELDD